MSVSRRDGLAAFDTFEFFTMLCEAFHKSLTHSNITSDFRKACIWSTYPGTVLSKPLPKRSDQLTVMLSVDELDKMFDEKVAQKASGMDL